MSGFTVVNELGDVVLAKANFRPGEIVSSAARDVVVAAAGRRASCNL